MSDTLTRKEWEAKGTALFGADMTKWAFRCPSCGNDDEARALLSIMFAERMGDAARALKNYGDARSAGAEAQIRALKSERDNYLAEVRRLSEVIRSQRG